jgi:N-acetylneuraminic acid mutarotase
LIVFGGYTEVGYTNDLLVINLKNESFQNALTTGKPPSPRENFASIFINDRIYIFGGFQEGGVLNDVYSIDTNSWTWVKVNTQGPSPSSRQGMGYSRVGKKMYVTGGCDYRAQKCFTDIYFLDTDSLWWTKIENK